MSCSGGPSTLRALPTPEEREAKVTRALEALAKALEAIEDVQARGQLIDQASARLESLRTLDTDTVEPSEGEGSLPSEPTVPVVEEDEPSQRPSPDFDRPDRDVAPDRPRPRPDHRDRDNPPGRPRPGRRPGPGGRRRRR